jgi:hypothetical protein
MARDLKEIKTDVTSINNDPADLAENVEEKTQDIVSRT